MLYHLGSGGRGVIAGRAHHPGEGSRVVACCDLNPATLERNREVYGREIYTTGDFRELLKRDVDAVFVTSPDFLHEEIAVAALRLGKAIYLEKPMAISVAANRCRTLATRFANHESNPPRTSRLPEQKRRLSTVQRYRLCAIPNAARGG